MIRVTRLNGNGFVLNSDRIERMDANPDTVITLTDDTKYVVMESLDEVVQSIQTFRAEILLLAHRIEHEVDPLAIERNGLSVVPGPTKDS